MSFPNNGNIYLPGTIQIPSGGLITAITNAQQAVITININPLTEANTYIPGQLVRLTVPVNYGMFQANNVTTQIQSISGDQLTVDLNTINFDPFVLSSTGTTPASLAPAGSRNLAYSNSTNQIAFQCLNNIGN